MTSRFNDWHGHFYSADEDRLDYFTAPRSRRDCFGPLFRYKARLPWDSDIEEAIRQFPDHAPHLRDWQSVWELSFPDWRDDHAREPEYSKKRSGPIEFDANAVADKSEFHRERIRSHIESDKTLRWIPARHFMSLARLELAGAPDVDQTLRDDPTVLDVLRSANIVLAFRHLRPQTSVIYAGGRNCILTGFDGEGRPLFEHTIKKGTFGDSSSERAYNTVWDCAATIPAVWRLPDLDPYRHGLVIGTYGGDEEKDSAVNADDSLTLLSAVVADMAVQGHTEVTIRQTYCNMFETTPKHWHVDIRDCANPVLSRARLTRDIPEPGSWMVTVEPRFHAEYRQRFFVYDGAQVGSASSDPAAAPRLDGRRFDDNVFDVSGSVSVFRPDVALNFEIGATKVAEALAKHGVRDYVLDLEIAGSAVVISNVLPILGADTYSFDLSLFMETVGREQQEQIAELVRAAEEAASDFGAYAPLMPMLVEAIGTEGLARWVAVSSHWYPNDHKSRLNTMRDVFRSLLESAKQAVRGDLFEQEEIEALGLKSYRNGPISDWLRSRPQGSEFVLKVCHWIAEKKGGSLSSRS